MTFLKFDSKSERTFIEIVMYPTVCIFWTYFYLWYNFIPVMLLFMCYQMNRMFTRWWSLNHPQAFLYIGVVETGLFVNMAECAIFGQMDGTVSTR